MTHDINVKSSTKLLCEKPVPEAIFVPQPVQSPPYTGISKLNKSRNKLKKQPSEFGFSQNSFNDFINAEKQLEAVPESIIEKQVATETTFDTS